MSTTIAQQDVVERLQRKVAILEGMIEESSSVSFVEAQQRDSLNALLHLSLQELPISDLLESFLDILLAQDFLNIENRGCVFLFNKESEVMEMALSRNVSQELVDKRQVLALGQCFCGDITREGQSFLSTDHVCHKGEGENSSHSNYCAPIKTKQELLGILCLTLPDKLLLSQEQIEFLNAGVDILAGAIQKTLYRDKIAAFNITQRQEVESALAIEKERLMVTLRSIGEGVIAADDDGRVILINKAAEKLTGWDHEEAIDCDLKDVLSLVNGETGNSYSDPVATVLKNGWMAGFDRHTILISRSGEKRRVAVSGAPIHDRQSQPIGVVLVCRDVTNELKMEAELQKKRQLLSLGVLAGGIAHDFNNILTAILGNIFLAGRLVEQDGKAFRLLKEAEKASQRAADLVQQLLTFSRGGEPVKQAASMKEIITTTTDFVLRGSAVACEYEIAEDLWLADVDSGQMSQVIQNLVINAKHAMPTGGGITIRGQNRIKKKSDPISLPGGEYVEIQVEDHGIGIPPERLARIFDPYFSTKETGSGLGLAISHSIIEKHAGLIIVESEVGAGTTFTFYVPAMRSVDFVTSVSAPQETKGNARVLIMDDDEMVRATTAGMLQSVGYQTDLAGDGNEAVEKYLNAMGSEKPFDIVIMDLTIPGGMGGRDAINILLQHDPKVKAVVASGYANDPILANPKEYGFMFALVKPFHIDDLTNTLGRIMDNEQ